MTEQNNANQEAKILKESDDYSLTEQEYQTCISHLKELITQNKINYLGFYKKDLSLDDCYYLNTNGLIETLPEIQYVNSIAVFRAGKGILLFLYSDNVEFFENLPESEYKTKMYVIRAYISLNGSFSLDTDAIYLFDEKNSVSLLTSQDFPTESLEAASNDASLIRQTQFTKLTKVFQD